MMEKANVTKTLAGTATWVQIAPSQTRITDLSLTADVIMQKLSEKRRSNGLETNGHGESTQFQQNGNINRMISFKGR